MTAQLNDVEYAIQVLQEGVLLSHRASLSDSSDQNANAPKQDCECTIALRALQDIQTALRLAPVAADKGEWTKAKRAYQKAIAGGIGGAKAQFALGECHYELREDAEAVKA